jgi:hypothetical protein
MLKNPGTAAAKLAQKPKSQISIMPDGDRPRLYCCHSMLTRDAAAVSHVISVGVDLSPALSAQGYDESALVNSIAEACRKGGGDAPIPAAAAEALRTVSKVLNIGWIGAALAHEATTICSRSKIVRVPQTPATDRKTMNTNYVERGGLRVSTTWRG